MYIYLHMYRKTPKGSNLHNRRQAQRSLRKRTPPTFRLKGGTIPPANVSRFAFRRVLQETLMPIIS